MSEVREFRVEFWDGATVRFFQDVEAKNEISAVAQASMCYTFAVWCTEPGLEIRIKSR